MNQYGAPYMGSKSQIAEDRVYFSSYEISDNRFYKVWSKEKIQNLNGQGAGAKVQETIYCNQPDKVMLF